MRHYQYLHGLQVNVEVYLSQWEWTYKSCAFNLGASWRCGSKIHATAILSPGK
jgi:hypothetical protein